MPAILKQLGALWKGLTATQKTLAFALVAFTVVAAGVSTFVGASPSYVLLRDGLDAASVSAALTKLDAVGVRRKVGPTGTEIFVDSRDFERARSEAATQKLFPDAGTDLEWEAAGSASLGLTEDQRRRRDLLAKQKTLAKTLESYDGIERATVTLTPAVKAYARRDASPAKGALVLKFASGFAPDGLQVEAWQRVTAAAIADLAPENVTVSDTKGQLLSRGSGSGSGAGAFGAPAFERRRAVERHLAEKAQSALDAAFGPGRSYVRVDATLDVESSEVTKRTLDSENRVAVQEKSSTSTGGARQNGGTPSTNAAGNPSTTTGGSNSEESSSSYEVGRTDTVTRREAGEIRRLTVAVALDQTLAAEESKVRELVQNATGWNKDRGEPGKGDPPVSVSTFAFAAPKPEEAPVEAGFDFGRWIPALEWTATAVLGLGLAWWALRAVKSAKALVAGAVRGVEKPKEIGSQRPADPKESVAMEIERDPETVGALLRGWLYEGAGAAAG
jgi:flagellar M-ring protein FliF